MRSRLEGRVPTFHYLRWSLETAYGGMVEPTVFAALSAVFKQEDPELLTSFRDTFWHVPSLINAPRFSSIYDKQDFLKALSFYHRTLISKTLIRDSIGSPYTGCLPFRYLLSNFRHAWLSNSGFIERPIPARTSRPAAARYMQISQKSREPSADLVRSFTHTTNNVTQLPPART
jgi:hypothetical protein